jgi:DNA-binding response OmpR family regulator
LTALTGEDQRVRTRAAGLNAYLIKPVDIERLPKAVSALVHQA